MYARSQGDSSCEVTQYPAVRAEKSVSGIFVDRLQVTHFRNYPFLRLELPERAGQIVLTGKNGVGKTNLMEAVSYLAPGKGMRSARFRDVSPKDEAVAGWGVGAKVRKGDEEFDLLTEYDNADGHAEKRRVCINGENATQADLGDICSVVWLTPAMDRLFAGEPAGRRRFLDRLTQAFFAGHASACAAYAQALRQWGALIRDGRNDERWLAALEKTMGKYGAKISRARRETVALLQSALDAGDDGVFPQASLALQGGWEEELASLTAEEADTFIQQRFAAARALYAQNGSAGGVHTVDLTAFHREKEMAASGCSTGEQKALLISILMAQARAQAERTGALPLMLLDEATAHLDERRQEAMLALLAGLKTQVWLAGTTAAPFESLKQTAHFVAVDELLRELPEWAAAS